MSNNWQYLHVCVLCRYLQYPRCACTPRVIIALATHQHHISHIYPTCSAPCLSNGVVDCDDCVSSVVCPPTSSSLSCQCTSDCFPQGSCCSDMTTIPNCFGKLMSVTNQIFEPVFSVLESLHATKFYFLILIGRFAFGVCMFTCN